MTIYFNNACSKCRKTLELVRASGVPFETVEYLETPPTAEKLDRLMTLLGMGPEQLVRKDEDEFERLGLDRDPPRSRQEWIQVLIRNPILIQRPIVTDGERAVIARPPENVLPLLEPAR